MENNHKDSSDDGLSGLGDYVLAAVLSGRKQEARQIIQIVRGNPRRVFYPRGLTPEEIAEEEHKYARDLDGGDNAKEVADKPAETKNSQCLNDEDGPFGP